VKTLFVMDPIDTINVTGDSTYMLMLEACKRGWPVFWCGPGDLYADGGLGWARVCPVKVSTSEPYFEAKATITRPLGEFDVVWMRKDPPFDMDYIFSTYLLDLVPPTTLVLNNPASIRSANEKMYAMQWSEYCPKTAVLRDIDQAMAWIAENSKERVVLKPWDGNGGRGVLVTHSKDANLRSMLEILTEEQSQFILVQEYIEEIKDGDKRVILIDGEPMGWMTRVPQPGDHRGNMHVGARVEACDLTPRDREICAAIGPRLRKEGLLFVGIDIIGSYLTEINVTSPTGIQEINPMLNVQLEKSITDAVMRAHKGECT